MRRSSLNVFSFLTVASLVVASAQGVFATEDDVQNHPLLQPESSWEEQFAEDFPTLENKSSANFAALEIISNGGIDTIKAKAEKGFSLGTVGDAVGGAISNVVMAPVNVVEKAVGTLSGLNPLNLLHNDKKEVAEEKIDNSILAKQLEIRSEYTNESYDEWFANETAESLVAQKPAPTEKTRMKIQILLQNFISSKDE